MLAPSTFGITLRELEILGLIAASLSNKEIAERIFVSQNTVLSSRNEARQLQLTGLAQCSDVYFSISSAAVMVDLSFLSGP